MKKKFIFLWLLPLFVLGQDQTKNYISVGFLDHKTGNSIIGYTRSVIQNENNELFIGFGSAVAINSFIIGYKKYLLRSSIDGYSVISIQKIYGMGGDLSAPCVSIGIEKRIWKILFLNIGINSTMRFSSSQEIEFITLPTLNLNIRY
tara:strand:- start:626 stop:1066 length:441 start_codon:yes stop_codon:yes gene_type:complete